MREIKSVVIHCSDSEWGTVEDIDRWHKERGWDGVGYHYVITNGRRTSKSAYKSEEDGVIQSGRKLATPGAHVRGHNKHSVGICLIGRHHFTGKQLYEGLLTAVRMLMVSYDLNPEDVYGHIMLDDSKTCPNFDVEFLRALLK